MAVAAVVGGRGVSSRNATDKGEIRES